MECQELMSDLTIAACALCALFGYIVGMAHMLARMERVIHGGKRD